MTSVYNIPFTIYPHRAKMNQQRSRRFRAAQDAKDRRMMMQEVIEEMKSLGMPPPNEKAGHSWDSNVITPGKNRYRKLNIFVRYE
jgi:5'-3' exoribonuclease 2